VCQGPPVRLAELDPVTDAGVAAELLSLQRSAYAVEATLIGDDRIPPLHESLPELRAAALWWLGAMSEERLVGAVAVRVADDGLDIDRLVVVPDAHRRGVGSALVSAVLDRAAGRPTTVSTGRDNQPARRLYERLGFAPTGDEQVLPGLWVTRSVHRGGPVTGP
jgi:ribosomal protein S18 acetylase RimI-like enzyme